MEVHYRAMTWSAIIASWAVAILVGVLGGYLAGYVRKKGENRAMHEDIDRVVRKTEEIKAEITGGVWDRQKRWELKREVLFRAAKTVADTDSFIVEYWSMRETELETKKQASREHREAMTRRLGEAMFVLEETAFLVGIACRADAKRAFDDFTLLAHRLIAGIIQYDTAVYRKSKDDLSAKLSAVRNAIRKELGFQKEPE